MTVVGIDETSQRCTANHGEKVVVELSLSVLPTLDRSSIARLLPGLNIPTQTRFVRYTLYREMVQKTTRLNRSRRKRAPCSSFFRCNVDPQFLPVRDEKRSGTVGIVLKLSLLIIGMLLKSFFRDVRSRTSGALTLSVEYPPTNMCGSVSSV